MLSGVFLKVFLQCCVSFCHTTARISHNYKKSIPSLPNLPPLPSLQPSGLAWSLRLGFPSHTQARTSYPFHMRQCVNPALSLPTMPTSPFPTSVVCLCVYTYAQWSITQHKKNKFESLLVRRINLEPVIQSEGSQKEKNKSHILMHTYGIQKNGTHDPACREGMVSCLIEAPIFPAGSEVKASTPSARDLGSIPGLGRFPWRRKWQPTPVFLPGESHGQRSLVGYSLWGQTGLSDFTFTFTLNPITRAHLQGRF